MSTISSFAVSMMIPTDFLLSSLFSTSNPFMPGSMISRIIASGLKQINFLQSFFSVIDSLCHEALSLHSIYYRVGNVGNGGYSYNTYLGYESKIKNYLKPAFGQYLLNGLQDSPDVIQSWVDDMKGRGFSKNMVKSTFACLSGALNYAILPLKYIKHNLCNFVNGYP